MDPWTHGARLLDPCVSARPRRGEGGAARLRRLRRLRFSGTATLCVADHILVVATLVKSGCTIGLAS